MRRAAYRPGAQRRSPGGATAIRAVSGLVALAMTAGTALGAQAKPAESAAVRSVLLHYGRSMESRDWSAACAVMTAEAKRQAIANARKYKHAKVHSCAEAYAVTFRVSKSKVGQPITSEWIKALKSAEIDVQGDTATAMGYTMVLTRRGRWLVST